MNAAIETATGVAYDVPDLYFISPASFGALDGHISRMLRPDLVVASWRAGHQGARAAHVEGQPTDT